MGQVWTASIDFVTRPTQIMIEVAKGRNVLDAWEEMATFVSWNLALNFPVIGHAMMVAQMVSRPPEEWTMANEHKLTAGAVMLARGEIKVTELVNLMVGTHPMPGNVAATYFAYLVLLPIKVMDFPPDENLYNLVCQFARMPVDDLGYEFKLQLAPGCTPIGMCLSWNNDKGGFDVVPMEPVITTSTLFRYGPDQRLKIGGQALASNGGSNGYYLRPDDAMAPQWLMLGNGTIVLKNSRRRGVLPLGLFEGAPIAPELVPLYEEEFA